MPSAFVSRILAVATLAVPIACFAQGQQRTAAVAETALFAVEITVGPNWDRNKPAHEQPFFQDHSANLKRLRDSGALVMGARYSDKGLVVLAAPDEAGARAMMDVDESIKAAVFEYRLHPMSVFYGGTLDARPRRTAR